jgi:hypothetical protein
MIGFAHSLAMLIGIDACGNGIPRLTTAVNDAMRLRTQPVLSRYACY